MWAEERNPGRAEVERVQRERRISNIVFGMGAARHGTRAETTAMRSDLSDGRRAGGEQERAAARGAWCADDGGAREAQLSSSKLIGEGL